LSTQSIMASVGLSRPGGPGWTESPPAGGAGQVSGSRVRRRRGWAPPAAGRADPGRTP
jgi:hypothetical protein